MSAPYRFIHCGVMEEFCGLHKEASLLWDNYNIWAGWREFRRMHILFDSKQHELLAVNQDYGCCVETLEPWCATR